MSARTQYLIEKIEEIKQSLAQANSTERVLLQEQLSTYEKELLESSGREGNILLG